MRYPAVAGTYYSSGKVELKSEIEKLISEAANEPSVAEVRDPGAFIVPHGWMSESGDVMASAYATLHAVQELTTFVIVGTDHFGKGKSVAISRDDWRTPLGVVKSDRELADAIKRDSMFADFDEKAHVFEPAIEVQLPFLQSIVKDFRCVAVSVGSHSYEVAEDIATSVYKAVSSIERNIIFIGSTDFSRDESSESAEKEDRIIIQLIKEMRAKDVMDEMEGIGSSICGPAVIGATVLYAEKAGLRPVILNRKVMGTGKKDNVKSFVSIAFGKQ